MKKTLVIVESPAKAKTIGRYLGKDYQIMASVGHVRDLPSSTLGVDLKKDFKPLYVTMKGKEKVVKELKKEYEALGEVLLATDPDREGEAIAWHLSQLLKLDAEKICRITFNEITQKAVKEALETPRKINLDLVNAQQARRIIDRLMGFELSPVLWKKVRKGLSAGRVQSVATRMIVDREEEIQSFVPEEYWHLEAELELFTKEAKKKKDVFVAKYYGVLQQEKIKKKELKNKEDVDFVVNKVKQNPFSVFQVTKKERKRKPYAPYTTSTLQQDAARKLSFTSKKTMSVAQQLYEGLDLGELGTTALVTYIRTDSVRISQEALKEARHLIESTYGSEYLPSKANFYANKNASQDAHEAIRPAHFHLTPESIKNKLSQDQYRLYQLIWNRFLASQMKEAVIDSQIVDVKAEQHIFRAIGENIRFPGFLLLTEKQFLKSTNQKAETEEEEMTEDILSSENTYLPLLEEGQDLQLSALKPEQKFTKPPARYNEASLIKAMEEEGIGRPSTYAPTLFTILERKYVEKEQKQLVPTHLGMTVTKLLKEKFAPFVNLKFTAQMEENLDTVEEGKQNWVEVMHAFYPSFHKMIEEATESEETYQLPVQTLEESCPLCQSTLLLREGRFGKFIACSAFPTCKFTKNAEAPLNVACPLCTAPLESRRSKKGKVFYVCSKTAQNSECPFISWYLPSDKLCSTCGAYMLNKKFRNKAYLACSNENCPSLKKKTKEEENESEQS